MLYQTRRNTVHSHLNIRHRVTALLMMGEYKICACIRILYVLISLMGESLNIQ